jgi:uncharacterized protein
MTAKEFLHFMISSLVEKSDAIEIEEKTDDLGLLLSLKVDTSDIWSVIGRGGKTIDSIRTVLRVFGSRTGTRVNLRIIEDKPII